MEEWKVPEHQKTPGRLGELEWGSEPRGRQGHSWLVGRKGAASSGIGGAGAPGKMERRGRGMVGCLEAPRGSDPEGWGPGI